MKLKENVVLKSICILTLFLCLFMVSSVKAEGGNKKSPFSIVSSVPSDGEKDVKISTDIKITFSKNVVNMSVKDENKKCFELQDDNGINVPIDIIMADDQMEREKRNDIILVPKEELKEGINYTVNISPEVQSKSGVKLGEELKISFTTAGGSKVQGNNYKTIVIILGILLIVVLYFYLKKRKKN